MGCQLPTNFGGNVEEFSRVLSPAYLSQAEDKFYRGESWQSPDTVPMTDEQVKEMKLKRQPEQKAISA